MSAAAERAALAARGRSVLAGAGPGRPPAADDACSWRELEAVPDWLCLPVPERDALARLVALAAMADTLAGSIDGAWLGALATAAGEDALDRVIALAGALPMPALPPVPAAALHGQGYAILAATLPPALRRFLPGASTPLLPADQAAALLALVRAGPA